MSLMNIESLNPDLEREAKELCASITVAHNLDEEIQEELFGHIEDKLLGYLNGKISITSADALALCRTKTPSAEFEGGLLLYYELSSDEDATNRATEELLYALVGDRIQAILVGEAKPSKKDALFLVRKHFGDAKLVKSMFLDVHAREVRITQARRYVAAAIGSMFCFSVGFLVLNLISIGVYVYQIAIGFPIIGDAQPIAHTSILNEYISLAGIMCAVGLISLSPWLVFRRWKRQLRQGDRPWYYRWSGPKMGSAIMLLLFVNMAVPSFPQIWSGSIDFLPQSLEVAFAIFFAGMFVLYCMSWIWWCDSEPRSAGNSWNAMAAWAIYLSLASFLPTLSLTFGGALETGLNTAPLLDGRFFNTSGIWALSWVRSGNSPIALVMLLVGLSVLGGIAVGVYHSWNSLRARFRAGQSNDPLGMA